MNSPDQPCREQEASPGEDPKGMMTVIILIGAEVGKVVGATTEEVGPPRTGVALR